MKVECVYFEFGGQLWRVAPDGMSAEVTTRSVEQIQPVVRQQDAALHPDKHGRSAAVNPDGDSLEAFEYWIESEIEMTNRLLHGYGRHSDKIDLEELRVVKRLISNYKRQGAA
jgi:hypothetical protein